MNKKQRPDTPAAELSQRSYPNSLFGEILDWMLAPMLLIWPVAIILTYNVATNIASDPYDKLLSTQLQTLIRLTHYDANTDTAVIDFPASPRLLLRSDADDILYYQIADTQKTLLGDSDIPLAPLTNSSATPQTPQFRDDFIQGHAVRIAYQAFRPTPNAPLLIAQLAETYAKRNQLSSQVITGVLLPQFAVIPMAVLLVWIGLTRGISPLKRLQTLIQHRSPTNLAPIPLRQAPEEVRPLIVSFNDMMQRLADNLQSQQRFIADAAHQMRTPLTGLKMQTELALQEEDPAQLRQSLQHMVKSTERTAHLINQLLVLAQTEANAEKPSLLKEEVDLNALLQEVAQFLFPRATQKNIDFGIECSTEPLIICGNRALLHELMVNLIDNAIKYTLTSGQVTARTTSDTPYAIFEVEDNGIGIEETDRHHVFERFFRVLDNGEDGSGLGLPIVKKICEYHDAAIALHNPATHPGTLARVHFTTVKNI